MTLYSDHAKDNTVRSAAMHTTVITVSLKCTAQRITVHGTGLENTFSVVNFPCGQITCGQIPLLVVSIPMVNFPGSNDGAHCRTIRILKERVVYEAHIRPLTERIIRPLVRGTIQRLEKERVRYIWKRSCASFGNVQSGGVFDLHFVRNLSLLKRTPTKTILMHPPSNQSTNENGFHVITVYCIKCNNIQYHRLLYWKCSGIFNYWQLNDVFYSNFYKLRHKRMRLDFSLKIPYNWE